MEVVSQLLVNVTTMIKQITYLPQLMNTQADMDKTMADKLMYIPKNDTQITHFIDYY